ncbi:hypothetical protein Q9R46_03590 [Paenibacillus sp. RRE4]|uniref:hypothetical protein n=1 Tax=Paenibacillus sp. RRE4 TaxID=2962587 RepID=UPI002881088A|nr:hypothetical protein [Paenibacillus sp. RRE4]MDT0121708.1 hypothetical protein [Paenibacillus sp. RRE4]
MMLFQPMQTQRLHMRELTLSHRLIGTAGYHCWNPNVPSSAEIGFDLFPSYWG